MSWMTDKIWNNTGDYGKRKVVGKPRKITNLWNILTTKNSLENCDASPHHNIIRDFFHDSCGISSYESQENGCSIQVPK